MEETFAGMNEGVFSEAFQRAREHRFYERTAEQSHMHWGDQTDGGAVHAILSELRGMDGRPVSAILLPVAAVKLEHPFEQFGKRLTGTLRAG
jgi:hypothetical protein